MPFFPESQEGEDVAVKRQYGAGTVPTTFQVGLQLNSWSFFVRCLLRLVA